VETVQEITEKQQRDADALVDGLRQLAAFVEANPQFGHDLLMTFDTNNVPHIDARGDAREYLAKYARAAVRSGAVVSKGFGDKWAHVDLAFGAVNLHVYAEQVEVCEKVVLGTREVTKEVLDPEALAAVPKVTVTETVEDVEWRCHPILDAAVQS